MDQYNKLYYITAIHCKSVGDFMKSLEEFNKDENVLIVCNSTLASDLIYDLNNIE
mgnify:CR=1 FL=1